MANGFPARQTTLGTGIKNSYGISIIAEVYIFCKCRACVKGEAMPIGGADKPDENKQQVVEQSLLHIVFCVMSRLNFYLSQSMLLLCLLIFLEVHPQPSVVDSMPQKDVIDLAYTLLKRQRPQPAGATREPGIRWAIVPGLGYTLPNGLILALSTNGAFFTDLSPDQNQSIVYTSLAVTSKSQATITHQHNIWSRGNKFIFTGDHRYWIYPQETFGLGGDTRLSDARLLNYRLLRVSEYVYRQVSGDWYAGAGYVLTYNHRIRPEGEITGSTEDFLLYGGEEATTSSGLGAALLYDTRRNQNNPVAGGRYLSVQVLQNFRWLGSNRSWRSLLLDTRSYYSLGKRNKLAFWGLGWFAFQSNPPYLDLPATAWDANYNSGRGYTQGRFRGKNLLYGEAEYRLALTRNGLFGAVMFTNVQTVTDWPSNRFSKIHPAAGGGLRIKFNKKSNTNIAIDYGFGADGSRGLFVNLGEVF